MGIFENAASYFIKIIRRDSRFFKELSFGISPLVISFYNEMIIYTSFNVNKYADVFYGNDVINLPEPKGIAEMWLFLKVQTGNNSPLGNPF